MNHFLTQWISLILVSLASASSNLPGSPLIKESEVDVRFKKQLPIYLQHHLGEVSIQGWNQDLIRVKVKKIIFSEPALDSTQEAESLFSKHELISLETPRSIELRVGNPQGTDLLTKLRNRKGPPKIRVDLEIKAPATLPITIVLGEGKSFKLSSWRGSLEMTGKNNTLEFNKLKISSSVNVNCQDCRMSVTESEFSGNILLKNQAAEFKRTRAFPGSVNISLQDGSLSMDSTLGDFRIRSLNGNLTSIRHDGPFQFQTEKGQISIQDFQGDLNVLSVNSEMRIHAIKIKNQCEIENKSGSIVLSLPNHFSGMLDLQSLGAEVDSEFGIDQSQMKTNQDYGPQVRGRLTGVTGLDSNIRVHVFSENGNILLKKSGASL